MSRKTISQWHDRFALGLKAYCPKIHLTPQINLHEKIKFEARFLNCWCEKTIKHISPDYEKKVMTMFNRSKTPTA